MRHPPSTPSAPISDLAREVSHRAHGGRRRGAETRTMLGPWRLAPRAGAVTAQVAPDPAAQRARIVELVGDPLGRGVVMASALVMTLLALAQRPDEDDGTGAP